MSTIAHPILPTAQAVKQAMDAILAKARDVIDVSPFLDAQGRLPFVNLLPMLKALPSGGGGTASKNKIIDCMMAISTAADLKSATITTIADDARLTPNQTSNYEGNVSLPNCTRIGARGFYNFYARQDDEVALTYAIQSTVTFQPGQTAFANLETIGEMAFTGVYMQGYVSFPKLQVVPSKAFWGAQGDVTLQAATTIASDAFAHFFIGTQRYQSTKEWHLNFFRRISTLRLPNLTASSVRAMPGYPFGLNRITVRGTKLAQMNGDYISRIICKGNEVIIPENPITYEEMPRVDL